MHGRHGASRRAVRSFLELRQRWLPREQSYPVSPCLASTYQPCTHLNKRWSSSVGSPIHISNVNEHVVGCEYAVRGDIVIRAQELEKQLKIKAGSLPFEEVVYCNIGNPQALGQSPITYFREVLALCDHPKLLDSAGAADLFSGDALETAQRLIAGIPRGAVGAYSHSQGLEVCRRAVAKGIQDRDGDAYVSSPDDIFLTDGASPAAQNILRLLLRGRSDGVMCPIPQYPLYSATITLCGGTLVPYYLDESSGWSMDVSELESQLARAQSSGVTVRALVVINPGNPTGQVLEQKNQEEVADFCKRHGLLLIADEVYQENVYSPDHSFTSFKKVVHDMGISPQDLPLVSLHSVSKGFYGECGRRGGYMEIRGLSPEVRDQLYKLASINLCSNVGGQILMALVMNQPKEGDPSFPQFSEEKSAILSSLARRAKSLVTFFNSLEAVTCTDSPGAMYTFPNIDLPLAAVHSAQSLNMSPDTFYARRLLDSTGIVVVPGSGFGQAPGQWHIRCTILQSEEKLPGMMERFRSFHERFMDEFRHSSL